MVIRLANFIVILLAQESGGALWRHPFSTLRESAGYAGTWVHVTLPTLTYLQWAFHH
jgi:hypothetical protein